MEKAKIPFKQILILLIGELLVSGCVIGVYAIINKFTYKVILGSVLGIVVTLSNYLVLAVMTNNVINKFLAERGDGEMSDEDAAALAMKFQGKVQNQIRLSFIIRNLVMLVTLIAAFFINIFDVIATLFPLLAFSPILKLSELIGRKADE